LDFLKQTISITLNLSLGVSRDKLDAYGQLVVEAAVAAPKNQREPKRPSSAHVGVITMKGGAGEKGKRGTSSGGG
jgi:hypothetical protein